MSTKEQIIREARERSQLIDDWLYTLPVVEEEPRFGKYGFIEKRVCSCGDVITSGVDVLVHHEWLQKHYSHRSS